MDNWLKVLLILGVIVFPIIKRMNTSKETPSDSSKKHPKTIIKKKDPYKSRSTVQSSQRPISSKPDTVDTPAKDFTPAELRSQDDRTEEIKKGIIWAEILNRKYI